MALVTDKTDQISAPGKPKFTLGIQQKVLLVMLAILLAALSTSSWLTMWEERENMLEEINQRGNDLSRYVVKSLAISMVGFDYHTIQLILDEITASEEITYALVTNKNGKVIGQAGISDAKTTPENVAVFKEKIFSDGNQVGNLEMGLSTEQMISRMESRRMNRLLREGLIISLVIIGIFLAMSRVIVRPVKQITRHLNNYVARDGHLTKDIPVIANDEFGQMSRQFNKLSTQLFSANTQLQSKVDMADRRVLETNAQLKQLNEEFKILSITDPLTGLYNRRHFDELMTTEIDKSVQNGESNSILLIDVDHFKAINDTFGHYVGDAILKNLTRTLKNNLRHTDAICRIGGEEFAILCRDADAAAATEIAEKLIKEVENTSLAEGVDDDLVVTISMGIASVPNSRETYTAEQIYKDVDAALYYSKNHGRNCFTHADQLYKEESSKTA